MKLRFLKEVLVVTSGLLLIGCTSTYDGDYVKAMEEFNKPSNSSDNNYESAPIGDTSSASNGSIVGDWSTGCIYQVEYDLYMIGEISFYANGNVFDKFSAYADRECSAMIESETLSYSYSTENGILTLSYVDDWEVESIPYTINSNTLIISEDYEEMVFYRK
jgi:hypothetical protein